MPLQPPSHSGPHHGAMPHGATLIEALANDTPTDAALHALWRAARTWLATGGAVPLERCARLPNTPGALRNEARNLWIRRAADLIAPGEAPFTQAQHLGDELTAFIAHGAWCAWRDAPAPPEVASDLRKALFYVAKYNAGVVLSVRHIARVIANK